MPGLVGVVSTRGPEEAARRFAIARDRMLRHGRTVARSISAFDGRCVLGEVSLSASAGSAFAKAPADKPAGAAASAGKPADLLIHGVVYGPLPNPAEPNFVERIKHTEGEFCLAMVDRARERVTIANDTVASYPLYWRVDGDGLVFASDLSAVLKMLPGAPRLDLRAVADYLTLGAVMGDKTLAEGVSILGPGTTLTYDVRGGDVAIEPYARIETFFRDKVSNKAAYFDAVGEAFTGAVHRASTSTGVLGLSLSGGLDSRAILGAVPRAVKLRTYTLGVEGCADQVIAKSLSDISNTQHFYFKLDNTYLRDFLPNMAQMVSMTDGMYLSHGLTEMLAIQFLDETGIGVLLRGHGGELAKAHLAWPLHTDAHVRTMTSLDQLIPYLSQRANYVTPDFPLSRFLTPAAAARAGRGTADSFGEALAGTGLGPADACSFLYLRELHRRFTIPSLELFRTRVDVRLPYVDPTFLKVLLAVPPDWRDSTAIHTHLTAAGNPALLKVRNSNTGARANAGAREEFVMDKLNTILKRLNVYGYRHYHNFDDWMRRTLLETVEAELLSPNARVLSFVDRAALGDLVRETREGKANRSYLLQVLLILELWQRENDVSASV